MQAILLTALCVVTFDALTKVGGRLFLPAGGERLFPGVVIRVFENARGPFGLGPLPLSLVASVGVLLALSLLPSVRRAPVAAGLVLGGGLANLGERLLFVRTTDLLVLGETTALNAADLAILVGLLALLRAPPRG